MLAWTKLPQTAAKPSSKLQANAISDRRITESDKLHNLSLLLMMIVIPAQLK